MPKVTFIVDGEERILEVDLASLPYSHHGLQGSLLDIAKNLDIPLEHACGGSCACTTCHVVVREGFDALEPAEEKEEDMLDKAWGLEADSRLSCQARVPAAGLVLEIPKYTLNHARETH